MKYMIVASLLFFAALSCKTKPYLKHELAFQKISDSCNTMDKSLSMNSNIMGERIEFQECLDIDFSKEQFHSIRNEDTVILQFKRNKTGQALYKIVVDIDSYPKYSFITIDGETFPVTSAGN